MKFGKGDIVIIDHKEGDWWNWVSGMDKWVGCEGVVEHCSSNDGHGRAAYYVTTGYGEGAEYFWYPETALRPADEELVSNAGLSDLFSKNLHYG